jgi:BirA family biotin operon repressor/biotin-[acetyl-CoA-carboxylase] ligase
MELPGFEVRKVERCGSTNAVLLAEGKPGVLLAAQEQTAGRGRRGKRWYSAPGAGVTFSLSVRIPKPIAGLSLVAGVGVARALRAIGVARVALKWPNDLVVNGAKLGGILVETRGKLAVIGIGINCRRDAALEAKLRRPLSSLDQFVSVDRDRIIEVVGASLLEAVTTLENHGLEPLRIEWERMHANAGERLRVRLANGRVVTGLARGLDRDGGLQLETRAGLRAVQSGRVLSARPA